ncbi:MAG: hypothetical protein AAF089_16615 [Bacteroidota bacterium]
MRYLLLLALLVPFVGCDSSDDTRLCSELSSAELARCLEAGDCDCEGDF